MRNIACNLQVALSTLETAARNVDCNCCRSRSGSYFCNITRNCFTVCPSSATLRPTMLRAMMHRLSAPLFVRRRYRRAKAEPRSNKKARGRGRREEGREKNLFPRPLTHSPSRLTSVQLSRGRSIENFCFSRITFWKTPHPNKPPVTQAIRGVTVEMKIKLVENRDIIGSLHNLVT